jgi:hypothetical protein
MVVDLQDDNTRLRQDHQRLVDVAWMLPIDGVAENFQIVP